MTIQAQFRDDLSPLEPGGAARDAGDARGPDRQCLQGPQVQTPPD